MHQQNEKEKEGKNNNRIPQIRISNNCKQYWTKQENEMKSLIWVSKMQEQEM